MQLACPARDGATCSLSLFTNQNVKQQHYDIRDIKPDVPDFTFYLLTLSTKHPQPRSLQGGRRLNQNRAKRLRLAYSAPGFYANPMFREFQETNLPAAIAREKEITKEILRKRAEMKKTVNKVGSSEKSLTRNKGKMQRQRQEKSKQFTLRQGQAGILPLAYEASDFPITAFKYPPYFIKVR